MSSKMKNLIVLAVSAFSVLLILLAGWLRGGNGESYRLLVVIGSACFILALVWNICCFAARTADSIWEENLCRVGIVPIAVKNLTKGRMLWAFLTN